MAKSQARKPREVMNPDALDQEEFIEAAVGDGDAAETIVLPAEAANGECVRLPSPEADSPSADASDATLPTAVVDPLPLIPVTPAVTYVTIRIPVAMLTDAQLRERPITHVQLRMPDAAAKVHRRVFQALNLGGFRRAGSKHVDAHPHVLAWILDQISDALEEKAKENGVAG